MRHTPLLLLVLVLALSVYGFAEGLALSALSLQQEHTSPSPPLPPPAAEQGAAAAVDVKEALLISFTELLQRVAPAAATSSPCPYPYTQVMHECFYPHTKKLTWLQARRVCQGMGGDLAEPRHIYALQTHLADTYGPGYFWVGATCEGGDGAWRWLSGRALDSEDWLFERPDNQGGDEHCLEMVMSDYPRVFNDETCSLSQRFVCQY